MEKCKCSFPGGCPWHGVVTDQAQYEQCQHGVTPTGAASCVYLGDKTNDTHRRVDQPIYKCAHFGRATLTKNRGGFHNCSDCALKQLDAHKLQLGSSFLDPLRIIDSHGTETHSLRIMLNGGAAFLVCGGPSLNTVDFMRLRERGVFSLGVNNVAGYAPVSAFVCSDPPLKFHSSIFFDPKIMKFLPTPKLSRGRGKLRVKENGKFETSPLQTPDCPNTWGFERRSWLSCDHTWFTQNSAAWGNHKEGVERIGEEKTVNTMFLGLRVLQYLGARTIFLLGVDFNMDPAKGLKENYSFGENRDTGACHSNNNQYEVASDWLLRLKPVFERFGFKTYNCNQRSHLRAFEYVDFETALEKCRGRVLHEPLDLEGWYVK